MKSERVNELIIYKEIVNFLFIYFYFIQCKAWRKYCNRSRGKRDFKASSGKDLGNHGLN